MLHKVAEEHQTFHGCVKRFQSWLLTETKRLTTLMERDETAESRLQALQVSPDPHLSVCGTILIL